MPQSRDTISVSSHLLNAPAITHSVSTAVRHHISLAMLVQTDQSARLEGIPANSHIRQVLYRYAMQ